MLRLLKQYPRCLQYYCKDSDTASHCVTESKMKLVLLSVPTQIDLDIWKTHTMLHRAELDADHNGRATSRETAFASGRWQFVLARQAFIYHPAKSRYFFGLPFLAMSSCCDSAPPTPAMSSNSMDARKNKHASSYVIQRVRSRPQGKLACIMVRHDTYDANESFIVCVGSN